MQTPVRSSRDSPAGAGWRCRRVGNFRKLLPHGDRPFSWMNPLPLWRSRNDTLARRLGDPVNDLRRGWVEHLPGRQYDFTVTDYAHRSEISVALLGDTGEGDGSQYAVVPGLLTETGDCEFMFIVSDVVYPAGGIDEYEDKFYRPYKDYPGPVYAVPGNHDWYDDLTGFMFTFCGLRRPPPKSLFENPGSISERVIRARLARPQPEGVPGRHVEGENAASRDAGAREPDRGSQTGSKVAGPGPAWKRFARQILWRPAPEGHENVIERMQGLRPEPRQRRQQPGPYLAIEAGPVLLVGIDTGITGGIDREQGEWLRRVSSASPKPKILLTGKPLYVNGQHHPGAVEGGGTVDDIVRAPAHNYIAAIGGDIHNYQRYPVTLGDGRTIQYIVSGGGGAFMHDTHKIPNIDTSGLTGVGETGFRCYPLRGDSLSIFSRNYGRLFSFGRIGQWLGFGRLLVRFWFIPPDQAAAIMAERLGLTPTRPSGRGVRVSWRSRLVASWLAPLPGQVHGPLQPLYSELLDWNDPPMFKSFLRLDATADQATITCFAATGCLDQEITPPVEDRVAAVRKPDGSWRWDGQ